MRFSLLLFLSLMAVGLSAQNKDPAFSFYVELGGVLTRSTMLAGLEDMKSPFGFAGGSTVMVRRRISPSLSLETGLGFRYLTLRQRFAGPRFGCDAPVSHGGGGQQTYLDSKVGIAYLTAPLAAIFYLDEIKDGLYLKPKLTLMLQLSNNSESLIYECGGDNTFDAVTADYTIAPFSLLPGLSVGYQFERDGGRTSFLEFNLAMATDKIIDGPETRPTVATGVLFDSGVVMAGITIGWQIGGKKKN